MLENQQSEAHLSREQLTKTQLRGSSLLLAGRLISVGIKFATQIVLIRYLSTADYGAFAWGLSVVAFCQIYSTLGLKQSVNRFVPLYHERKQYEKLYGTLILGLVVVLLTGAATAVLVLSSPPQLLQSILADERLPLVLLSIVIFLVPLEAIDLLLTQVFASFSEPNAIFFRKYILAPGLNLLVVLLLVTFGSDVEFLAYGYVAAAAAGVLLYLWVLIEQLRREKLLEHFSFRKIRFPTKELFSFSIPLLSSDLYAMLMASITPMLIGFFHPSTEVAFYRAVLPAARLNTIVAGTLAILFTPAAARLFARGDAEGLKDFYWKTAAWTAALSFPVFVLTFSTADPLTVFLFGSKYESSGVILALLSLGLYFDSAIGHNGATLKALGAVRYLLVVNLTVTVLNVAACIFLIPRWGALGAAAIVCATFFVHNSLKQWGLARKAQMSLFDSRYLTFYLTIVLLSVALIVLDHTLRMPVVLAFALAIAASLFVMLVMKRKLGLLDTFPELMKIPLVRKLLT